jgi:hypothetical protein
MRHCIVCHAEYAADPRRCPDCGTRTLSDNEVHVWTELRDDLTNEAMVATHVFEGPVDRALLTEILRTEQVPHMVRGNDFGGATLSAQPGGWGVLLVTEDDVERAKSLIAQYEESVVPETDAGSFDPDAAV